MQAKAILIGFLTVLSCYAWGQDVRNVKWGMTKAQVQSAEKSKGTLDGDGDLMFKVTISGSKYTIFYEFVNNKLASALFIYNEKHYNKNAYVEQYNSLKDVLTRKYGEPEKDNIEWSNDLYKNDPGSIGLAVSIGHVKLTSVFGTGKTWASVLCYGDNFDINLAIKYVGKEYRDLLMEKQNSKEDSDF